MKYRLIKIIAVVALFLLYSCASTGSGKGSSLREAVEQTSDEIAKNLPSKSRVAILSMQSVNDNLSEYIIDELTLTLFNWGIEVADRQNLEFIYKELNFQYSGYVSDDSIQSFGKFLGAQYVITGQLRDVGDAYSLMINAINVEEATRASVSRFDVRKDTAFRRMVAGLRGRTRVTPSSEPQSAGAFLDRGILFASRGDYVMAIADFNEAIRLDPAFFAAYMNRGMAYLYYDSPINADLAIADFTQAIRLNPNNSWAYKSRGEAYVQKQDAARAIDDLTIAISLDPKNAWAYYDRGMAYLNLRGDYDLAIENFTQAIRIESKYAMAYTSRGEAYERKKDYARALEDMNRAVQLDPNDEWVFIVRGNLHTVMNNYDRAINDLNQAIKINPENATAYSNRGEVYRAMNNYRRAIEDYNRAIQLDPNKSSLYRDRGNIYSDMNNYDRAIEDYNTAINLDPTASIDFFNHWSYATRGHAYLAKGNYDRAIADYETAIRLGNNDQWVRDQLDLARRMGR